MARMMASFVQMAVLRHARDIPKFERAQREGRWHYIHPRHPAQTGSASWVWVNWVGGRQPNWPGTDFRCKAGRVRQGRSRAWCARRGEPALGPFLRRSEILVCMLPLTPATTGPADCGAVRDPAPGCCVRERGARPGGGRTGPGGGAAKRPSGGGDARCFATEPLPPVIRFGRWTMC